MTMTTFIFVLVFTLATQLDYSFCVFSPNVTVISCTSHRVVVKLENAAPGGLIYIKGRGSACSKTTTSDTMLYEFDFRMCSLEYDTKFRVIVQQNPRYQTGYDKVIPIMCLIDTGDLLVTGVIFPEEQMDVSVSVNKTVRPTVSMRIMVDSDGTGNDDIIREVTIDDKVKMSLSLDEPFLRDFDIKAKDCTASLIPLVKDECSADEELFPDFVKKSRGNMTSTFNAFQPTNLDGDVDVDVTFTCSVAVCKGECLQTVCKEIVGWGRKKRDADDNDDIVENVTVGTTLRVKSPHLEPQAAASEYCAEKVVVTTVTVFTSATLIFSWIICGCVLSKMRSLTKEPQHGPKKPSALRRMSEKNINFARSVGRRLSSMLNLPMGYDMRDPGMMETIPDMQHSPDVNRRNSVTVSIVDVTSYVSANDDSFSNDCSCRVRKRCVDSAAQTDRKNENEADTSRNTLNSGNEMRRPTKSPITSLSIKTNALNSEQIAYNRNINIQFGNEEKRNNIAKVTDSCLYYTADDVPKNREVYRIDTSVDSVRSVSPPPDYESSNILKQNVGLSDGYSVLSKVLSSEQDSKPEATEIVGNKAIDPKAVSDKRSSNSDSRSKSPPCDYDVSKVNSVKSLTDPRGGASSVYRTIIETGSGSKFGESDSFAGKVKECNGFSRTGNDVESENMSEFDDIYEAIEIGAQVKRERKYSTHV